MSTNDKKPTRREKPRKSNSGPQVGRTAGGKPRTKPVISSKTRDGVLTNVIRVPECSSDYLRALYDPFSHDKPVCVPCDLFPLPSTKVRAVQRTTMALGTTGYGFASFKPTSCNDNSNLTVTTAASVGGAATALSGFTATQSTATVQLPYTSAQCAAGVKTRLVAAGMRVKYIGKLMDRNGVVVGYEDPDNDAATSKSYNDINSNPYSKIERVGDKAWDMAVCYSGPTTPYDLEFNTGDYPRVANNLATVIAISGVAGDIYEVEYVVHLEYIGNIVTGKSPSHADPGFFSKVVETVKSLTSSKPLQPSDGPSLWSKFKNAVISNFPIILEGGKAVASAVMGDFPGSMTSLGSMTGQAYQNAQPYQARIGYQERKMLTM